MRNKLIAALILAASSALAMWVYPPTGQEATTVNGVQSPASLPIDGTNGAAVFNPLSNSPVMLVNGWRIERAVPAVANGYVRFWNSQMWTYDANGVNADASYNDIAQTTLDAIAASNAVQAAIAASNAAVAQASATYTAMTNAWLTAPTKLAAQQFRQVWTNYTSLGSITNPAIYYQQAIPMFMNLGTNVTQKQITDCILWEWAYSQLSPFLNIYFPPTGSNTWPMVQNAPWSILP